MSDLDDIEKAVAKLGPTELAEFRAWFETFEAEQFDWKLERDAKAGELDRLAEEALAEYAEGRARHRSSRNLRNGTHAQRHIPTLPPSDPL